jgi:uncharacterized protein
MSTDDAAPANPTSGVSGRTEGRTGDRPRGRTGAGRPGPIAATERVELLDVLRGFALLGILVVNMQLFKSALAGAGVLEPFPGTADRAASWLISFAFESKFYVLFSFLFGYGLSVQVARAAAQGAALAPRYLRRLGALLLIGFAHALLLYTGDILVAYAVLGLVLLWARTAASRTLLSWAAALLLGWALVLGLSALSAAGAPELSPADQAAVTRAVQADAAEAEAAYRGTPADVVAQRARELPLVWTSAIGAMVPVIVAMFLVGMWAGRAGVLAHAREREALLRRARRVGLAVGVPGAAIYAAAVQVGQPPAVAIAGYAVGIVAAPALSAVYATTIALARRPEGPWSLSWLAPVGRMALSNYLLQSLACSLIFTGYGLGLFGRVGPLAGFGLSVAIFAVQIPLSAWWLRRFRFGPAEWVLRSITYLRVQPMRAEEPAAAVSRRPAP